MPSREINNRLLSDTWIKNECLTLILIVGNSLSSLNVIVQHTVQITRKTTKCSIALPYMKWVAFIEMTEPLLN